MVGVGNAPLTEGSNEDNGPWQEQDHGGMVEQVSGQQQAKVDAKGGPGWKPAAGSH